MTDRNIEDSVGDWIREEIDREIIIKIKYLAMLDDIEGATKAEWRLAGVCNHCGGVGGITVDSIFYDCIKCGLDD